MAAISLLGFSLPQGLILSKAVNSNMASSVLMANNNNNNKQDSISSSKTFSKITVQNVLGENNGNSINISNNIVSGHNGASLNNSNTIVRKIKDFGMAGAVNNVSGNSSLNTSSASKSLIIRKRPLAETKNILNESNKPATPVTKKPKQTKESTTPKTAKKTANENVQRPKKSTILQAMGTGPNFNLNPKPAGTPGRKGLPLPQAVARRNARERNRVKQVNNGFAALRERIPEEVAEAFESQGSGRGGNSAKKLSKVETLRMAVEYIRSLERLLGFDFTINGHDAMAQQSSYSSGEDSYTMIKDEFDTLSPSMDENFDDSMSNYDMDDYFSASDGGYNNNNNNNNSNNYNDLSQTEQNANSIDLLPDITTLNGLQYIRIPGTNTYQLLTPDIFVGSTHSPPNSSVDDEHFNALIDTNCLSPTAVGLPTSPINVNQTASPTTANSILTTTPASPRTQNGECVNNALSRLSPVPQMPQTSSLSSSSSSSTSATSSPDAGSSSSQYCEAIKPATISPANVAVNEHSSISETCATTVMRNIQRQFIAPTLPHLLPQFIKQEYAGDQVDFASTTKSPIDSSFQITATTAGDQHATLSLSPPLDRCNRLLIASHHTNNVVELPSFYEQDDSTSFYDNNMSFKKDLNDVLLDASTTAQNAGLSDESMIEAIDWWEAHTPQSEVGVNTNAVLL